MTDKFEGFNQPQENWSKLPHTMIESLPLVSSLGELKVIMYVLRHTWGFNDDSKKITLDEFQHGRKRSDGSRFDNGTGLTKPTIISGIERAIEHGFLCEHSEGDPGRVKKFYHLNMGGVKNLYRGGKESLHRSEKETKRKKQDSSFAAAKTGNPDEPQCPECHHALVRKSSKPKGDYWHCPSCVINYNDAFVALVEDVAPRRDLQPCIIHSWAYAIVGDKHGEYCIWCGIPKQDDLKCPTCKTTTLFDLMIGNGVSAATCTTCGNTINYNPEDVANSQQSERETVSLSALAETTRVKSEMSLPDWMEDRHLAILRSCEKKGHYTPTRVITGDSERVTALAGANYLPPNRKNNGHKRVGAYGLTEEGRAILQHPTARKFAEREAQTIKQAGERAAREAARRKSGKSKSPRVDTLKECPVEIVPYAELVSRIFYGGKPWVDLDLSQRKFIRGEINKLRKRYTPEDLQYVWEAWLPEQNWPTAPTLRAFTNGSGHIDQALAERDKPQTTKTTADAVNWKGD
jgi:ssDNA-binding Zn-finger/Zn-ribbon topoisomerase 1